MKKPRWLKFYNIGIVVFCIALFIFNQVGFDGTPPPDLVVANIGNIGIIICGAGAIFGMNWLVTGERPDFRKAKNPYTVQLEKDKQKEAAKKQAEDWEKTKKARGVITTPPTEDIDELEEEDEEEGDEE